MYSSKADIQIHSLSPQLCKAIKECRIALELSPQEFARLLGKTPAFINDLEQSKVRITSDVLENSAKAFGLSVGELVAIAFSEAVPLVIDSKPKLSRLPLRKLKALS